MDVAPARVDLDEPARQQELLAEPGHRPVGVEAVGVDGAVDGRDAVGLAREAALHERVGQPAHRAAEAGVDIAHGGTGGERAPAGRHAQRGSDVDDRAHRGGVVAEQSRQRHRGADGAEGAVRMHGQPGGRGALDPRAHLVAGHEGGEQVAPRAGVLLGDGPRERDDLDARVAVRVQVALVHVDPGAGGAVQQRRAGGIGAPPGPDHGGSARPVAGQVARDQRAHLGDLHAVHGDAQAVGDDHGRALAHGRRQRVEWRGRGPGGQAVEVVHAQTVAGARPGARAWPACARRPGSAGSAPAGSRRCRWAGTPPARPSWDAGRTPPSAGDCPSPARAAG